MTLMMTSAQVVETSVNVTNNSPSRDYFHPDDQTTQTTETPGFKPLFYHQFTDSSVISYGWKKSFFKLRSVHFLQINAKDFDEELPIIFTLLFFKFIVDSDVN